MKLRPQPGAVRLMFGGDVMMGRRVADAIEQGRYPLASVGKWLREADAALVNLECVTSPLGEPAPGRRFHFRAHPKTPALLAAAGVDVVSLANNHARDFGDAAFADAVRRLGEARVQAADGSPQPVLLEAGDHRLAVFACEDTASEALLGAIRETSRRATVIVLAHWGTEHSRQPDDSQRALAGPLVEAGARLIVGSGPHARQAVAWQRNALVAWSLGNLIFDGPGPDGAWSRGALLEVTLGRDVRILRARELPVRLGDDGSAEVAAAPK
jgi:poly-gamma-glutamate capsule biosynthesis protein CapA/YwtB (metallophosphatase superfamily)